MPSTHQPDEDPASRESPETDRTRGDSGGVLGDYRLLEKLAEGSLGEVYKAHDRRLRRVVALRRLPASFARDPSAVMRFKQAAATIGRFKHPNIAAVLDSGEDRGIPYLVTEYVEGRDLDAVVRQHGPLRVGEALTFLIQAARGLEAAHQRGIVHHRVKPSNLMIDHAGTVRLLGLALQERVESSRTDAETRHDQAPEPSEAPGKADHRTDIHGLGCSLYFLLTGRTLHREQPIPSICAARPDAPSALEAAFRTMVARRPDDRPRSMAEVVALLEACRATAVGDAAARPSPRNIAEGPPPHTEPERSAPGSSMVVGHDPAGGSLDSDQNLDELLKGVHSEMPVPSPRLTREINPPSSRPRPTSLSGPSATRVAGWPAIVFVLIVLALSSAAIVRLVQFSGRTRTIETPPLEASRDSKPAGVDSGNTRKTPVPALPTPEQVVQTIFDGKSGKGWMLTNRKPIPPSRIGPDGLNPHGAGSYIIVHEKKLGDFVLDFDYKLSEGCTSGVFLRVGDLGDPVNTGIEVALADTTGTTSVDSGAFYDLVAPNANVQKPAGQWNHMTITAAGPVLAVAINGKDVSRINLDEWTVAGKRPDGSEHKYQKRPIAELPRSGYVGFQDHGHDCWFRTITLKRHINR